MVNSTSLEFLRVNQDRGLRYVPRLALEHLMPRCGCLCMLLLLLLLLLQQLPCRMCCIEMCQAMSWDARRLAVPALHVCCHNCSCSCCLLLLLCFRICQLLPLQTALWYCHMLLSGCRCLACSAAAAAAECMSHLCLCHECVLIPFKLPAVWLTLSTDWQHI
jgi:hypothetical protein